MPKVVSSGYTGTIKTKESARRDGAAWLLCGHMFLLCGAGPYVCIGWLWAWGSALCFYYAALGYMFLLVGCRRARWAICFNCMCVCVYVCVCMCICVCVYMCVCVCVCV